MKIRKTTTKAKGLSERIAVLAPSPISDTSLKNNELIYPYQ